MVGELWQNPGEVWPIANLHILPDSWDIIDLTEEFRVMS